MRNMVLISLFLPIIVSAQITAPDFTLTDIDGNVRNLYAETDGGKVVVLDFFSTLCGTCITNTPVLETIWQDHGYSGDSLFVWGIESNGVSDSLIRVFEDTYFSTFPLFGTSNDDIVIYVYNITFTPQYFVVCPDRSMKPYDITNIETGIISCGLTASVNSDKQNSPEIYSFMNEIIVRYSNYESGKFYLQVSDMLYNKLYDDVEVNMFGETRLEIKSGGLVFYRLVNTDGRVIKTGKLYFR